MTARRRRSPLQQVDLTRKVKASRYERELPELQRTFAALLKRAAKRRRSVVIAIEGWDASGKSGLIRRLTAPLDAGAYRVFGIRAPTATELRQPFLQRFRRKLARKRTLTIFDRTWYGRVLVERVEHLASTAQWREAYTDIRSFEQDLIDRGVILVKLWLQISPREQLRRFKRRARDPEKRHKITREDWRNRAKRPAYEIAIADMLALSGFRHARWKVIPAESKKVAHLAVLRALRKRIKRGLRR